MVWFGLVWLNLAGLGLVCLVWFGLARFGLVRLMALALSMRVGYEPERQHLGRPVAVGLYT